MRILLKLIVLVLLFTYISNFANGKSIKTHEEVEDTDGDVVPAITVKPTTKSTPISDDSGANSITPSTSTTGNSKVINPPNHQTVAPNDVPTFKPSNTKQPEYQPLTSLPPTQAPPKSAAPTTTMPPKGSYQPPPQIPNKTPSVVATQAPATDPPVNDDDNEETETPATTLKPSKTKTPKPTETVEEETEKPSTDLSSFSLETDKPTQTPKQPKTTPPTNLIPTFSESSFDTGLDSSNSDSSDSFKLSSNNQMFLTLTLISIILNLIL